MLERNSHVRMAAKRGALAAITRTLRLLAERSLSLRVYSTSILLVQTATCWVPLQDPVQLEPPPPLAPPVTNALNGCPLFGSTPSGVGACLELVPNLQVKTTAKRATWLGNDETHYVRKWADKDLSDLKLLLDLTIHWIAAEILTKKFEASMPDPKKAAGK